MTIHAHDVLETLNEAGDVVANLRTALGTLRVAGKELRKGKNTREQAITVERMAVQLDAVIQSVEKAK